MTESWVRGAHGLLRFRTLEEHGFSLKMIKEWRERETAAGRPSGLADFYAAYGLCFDCESHGARMIGWGAGPAETEVSNSFGTEELPLYGVCSTCGGSGHAPRS